MKCQSIKNLLNASKIVAWTLRVFSKLLAEPRSLMIIAFVVTGKIINQFKTISVRSTCEQFLNRYFKTTMKTWENSFCNVNHLAEYIIEVGQCLDRLNKRTVSYNNLNISFSSLKVSGGTFPGRRGDSSF